MFKPSYHCSGINRQVAILSKRNLQR